MSPEDEAVVRADERRRIADLVDQNADSLGAYAADTVAAVHLVAMVIGLGTEIDGAL